MKKKLLFIACLLSIFCETPAARSQWLPTNGPKDVNCLEMNGTKILAGTNKGLFLSTNDGKNWIHPSNFGLTDSSFIIALAVVDKNLFAVVGNGHWHGNVYGIYRSTDNGNTWESASNGLTQQWLTSLAAIGTNLFVGTDSGIFRTSDGGKSWIEADSGLTRTYVRSLIADGSYLIAATNNRASGNGGVFLSINFGFSWSVAGTGLDAWVNAFAVSGAKIYAGGYGSSGGVFRSDDTGRSWIAINAGLSTSTYLFGLAVSGHNLFASTGDGIFLSTDSGLIWTSANLGLPSDHSSVKAFVVSGSNIFASVVNQGVWIHKGKWNDQSIVANSVKPTNSSTPSIPKSNPKTYNITLLNGVKCKATINPNGIFEDFYWRGPTVEVSLTQNHAVIYKKIIWAGKNLLNWQATSGQIHCDGEMDMSVFGRAICTSPTERKRLLLDNNGNLAYIWENTKLAALIGYQDQDLNEVFTDALGEIGVNIR